jgi:hypothetical protein
MGIDEEIVFSTEAAWKDSVGFIRPAFTEKLLRCIMMHKTLSM